MLKLLKAYRSDKLKYNWVLLSVISLRNYCFDVLSADLA